MNAATSADDPALASLARGDFRTAARIITRVESSDPSVHEIVATLYRRGGGTPVIGVTGPPGAGKSTLVDALLARLRARGERVAVLAVDPSSPFSGGAILGDRVRMVRHNADPGVFIRSMAARGRLGGLARATGDALSVLDAMGFAAILVETVGVGQSEIDILRFARTVLVVQTPAAGDAVQTVKAGVLEVGDVFVVNKADAPGADRALSALRESVEFRAHAAGPDAWNPPVLKAQANEDRGIGEVLAAIEAHSAHLSAHPAQSAARRRAQARAQLVEHVAETLRTRHSLARARSDRFEVQVDALADRTVDPQAAAERLLEDLV